LKAAKVLIIGAGGLGSPAILYLAGAGVGTIGVVDADLVDESNLHRQVIHMERRVDVPKVQSAKEQISEFNRHTRMVTFQTRFTPENAMDILKREDWDVVMDGSDNAATRYLISDACVIAKKPLVSASALQWEGQATVYNYKGGPCYRCLFPKATPGSLVTNCSDGGVVGMVPGLMGQIQALEVVKILIGQGNVLSQRLIVFDALEMTFRQMKIRGRNPKCQSCGDEPSITDVKAFDYDSFCQVKCDIVAQITLPQDQTIKIEDFNTLNKDQKLVVIDVRVPVQYGVTNIEGSINIPLSELQKNPQPALDICQQHDRVFVMCRRGIASKEATDFLISKGVRNAVNVEGGMNALALLDERYPLY
jgi:adenylyltransferase/sulfurtransferase